jgi:glutamyl/glutaminyl-tRNA synthetase
MIDCFDIKNINKSHKVIFDNDKLDWVNHKHIVNLSDEKFIEYCKKYCNYDLNWEKITILIKEKLKKFNELNYELSILNEPDIFPKSYLYDYKKNGYNINNNDIITFLNYIKNNISDNMTSLEYENSIREYSKISGINFGSLMYVYRIVITGRKIIIMSATDVSELINKNNVIKRINDFMINM